MKRVAVFVSFSGQGGVEHMITHLVREFAAAGHAVDLLLVKAESAHLARISPAVRIVRLGTNHTFTSVFALRDYLLRDRPDALLVAKDRAMKVAVLARLLAGVPTRLIGRLGTTVSAALDGKGRIRRWAWYAGMRWTYPKLDGIVAISEGVAQDIVAITGLPRERIQVIPNPVLVPEMYVLAREEIAHPWLATPDIPIIMGAGRLTAQKDFHTLLRAFTLVLAKRPVRLIILGEGQDRNSLAMLARELGVDASVDMVGFQSNPYAWLARASLFVLSSRWEGFGNVLAEAMALGVPVASTDCPSGPREVLVGGRYGPLAPVGDAKALAEAMLDVLEHPPAPELLRGGVREYRSDISARRYLEVLGL